MDKAQDLLEQAVWVSIREAGFSEPVLDIGAERSRTGDHPTIRRVENAVLLSDPVVAGVVREDRLHLFNESTSYHPWRTSELRRLTSVYKVTDPPSVGRLAKAVALCYEWSDNFWHWIVEYLPFALDLEASGFDGLYLVPATSKLFTDTLVLLGIPVERIFSKEADIYLIRDLYFPIRGVGQNPVFPPLIYRLHQMVQKRFSADPPTRLYIARRNNRIVLNEEDVMAELSRWGFTRIFMEDFSIEEQISVASCAEAICGPHGAGMTAAVFMKAGGALIEIFSPVYINPCMLGVCEILNHKYAMVLPRVYREAAYSHGLDIDVDISSLRAALVTTLNKKSI